MLAASKADLLAFGKGEATIVAIARRLAAGEPVAALRDLRGVAYLLGARGGAAGAGPARRSRCRPWRT